MCVEVGQAAAAGLQGCTGELAEAPSLSRPVPAAARVTRVCGSSAHRGAPLLCDCPASQECCSCDAASLPCCCCDASACYGPGSLPRLHCSRSCSPFAAVHCRLAALLLLSCCRRCTAAAARAGFGGCGAAAAAPRSRPCASASVPCLLLLHCGRWHDAAAAACTWPGSLPRPCCCRTCATLTAARCDLSALLPLCHSSQHGCGCVDHPSSLSQLCCSRSYAPLTAERSCLTATLTAHCNACCGLDIDGTGRRLAVVGCSPQVTAGASGTCRLCRRCGRAGPVHAANRDGFAAAVRRPVMQSSTSGCSSNCLRGAFTAARCSTDSCCFHIV